MIKLDDQGNFKKGGFIQAWGSRRVSSYHDREAPEQGAGMVAPMVKHKQEAE